MLYYYHYLELGLLLLLILIDLGYKHDINFVSEHFKDFNELYYATS